MGIGLEVDFQQTLKAVKTMEVLSDLLKEVATEDVGVILTEVLNNWDGEAASAFLNKANLLYDLIYQSSMAIHTAAKETEGLMQKIHKAERAAIVTVHERMLK